MKAAFGTGVAVFGFTIALYAQATFPELAARVAPGPLTMTAQTESVSVDLPRLVAHSELIVDGTAAKLRTYMSPDQHWIFTDYLITPRQVLWDSSGRTSTVPRAPQPIVVKTIGGALTVNGVDVTLHNKSLAPIDQEEAVLFLTHDRSDPSKFQLVHTTEGVFYVREGRVFPASDAPAYASLAGRSNADLEGDILRLKR